MGRTIRWLLGLSLAVNLLVAASWLVPLGFTVAQTKSRYFPETHHYVKGLFLQYWGAHGGLAQQGYPLTEEFAERSKLNGQTYTVQYFERAIFERHPENAGTPYEVLLTQLGKFELDARYPHGSQPAAAPLVVTRGLGLTRAEWETRHGPGGAAEYGGIPYAGGYLIGYTSAGAGGVIAALFLTLPQPVGIDAARTQSRSFLPGDAQPVRLNETVGPPSAPQIYDTYFSPWLSTVIPPGTPNIAEGGPGPDIWNGARPGTFTVRYDPGPDGNGTKPMAFFLYPGGHN